MDCPIPPLNCFHWPNDSEDFEFTKRCIHDFSEKCAGNSPLTEYVDTISIARDVDAVRFALGEEKWTFFGLSYGTRLGTAYLELFPERVRAMLMDGVADHTVDGFHIVKAQVAAADAEFNRFAEWCHSNSTCPLHGQDVRQIAKETMLLAGDRSGILTENIFTELEEGKYIHLAKQLDQARNASSHVLDKIFRDRKDKAEFAQKDPKSTDLARMTIDCHDSPTSNTTFSFFHHADQDLFKVAPILHNLTDWKAFYSVCAGFPFAQNPPRPLHLQLSSPASMPPVLVVNSLHDIRTPYASATNLQRQIPGAVLLTTRVTGHCSYDRDGGQAADLENAFLISGGLPESGLVVDGYIEEPEDVEDEEDEDEET